MDRTSLEFWEWFYDTGRDAQPGTPDERRREVEKRWDPDIVVVQTQDILDTAGEFHGYEGLAAVTRELHESYDDIRWRPKEVHDLGDDRYLVLMLVTGRGRTSGIELAPAEVGHIVTFRGGRAIHLESHLGWESARRTAGVDQRS